MAPPADLVPKHEIAVEGIRAIKSAAGRICTLVGPTRHFHAFDYCSWRLGRLGWLVFSVGSHRAADSDLNTSPSEMQLYAATHRQKIALSQLVYVVDLPEPGGGRWGTPEFAPYIGDHTAAEIEFARRHECTVERMSSGRFPAPPVPLSDHSGYHLFCAEPGCIRHYDNAWTWEDDGPFGSYAAWWHGPPLRPADPADPAAKSAGL